MEEKARLMTTLLEIKNLETHFQTSAGTVQAVD
ncbi:MAG: hypothetical protein ACI8PT_001978, partial [Gammaproteobacteria bacterium]